MEKGIIESGAKKSGPSTTVKAVKGKTTPKEASLSEIEDE